jgi:hypothetical protein
MFNFKRTVFFGVLFLLTGCQSNPTFETFTTLLPWTKRYSQVQAGFEYILVSANEHDALMALGERRFDESKNHLHERWYTGQGEMLYLVDGRIQQALGFTYEIRGQTHSAPHWNELINSRRELIWRRQMDLMPGFRYGVVENITSFRMHSPSKLPSSLPISVQWVADLVESKSSDGLAWRYVQRFALQEGRVVYSEQCIGKELCLKIQHLGLLESAK